MSSSIAAAFKEIEIAAFSSTSSSVRSAGSEERKSGRVELAREARNSPTSISDLLFPAAANAPPPVVLGQGSRSCWGCGKAPNREDAEFQICPQCDELNLPQCSFCSNNCFAKNWSRHHKFHKLHAELAACEAEKESTAARTADEVYANAANIATLTEGTEADILMAEAYELIEAQAYAHLSRSLSRSAPLLHPSHAQRTSPSPSHTARR